MNKVKIVGSGIAFAIMFVAGWEGLSLTAYRDIGGVPTICYGETEDVNMGDSATPEECRARLKAKVKVFWDRVDELVIPPMTPWQHGAFTSFAYNVGLQAFAKSTMLRKFNAGQVVGACDELLRWIYVGREKVRGLERRRSSEHLLCLGVTAE